MDIHEIETPTRALIEEALDAGDLARARTLVGYMERDWLRNKDYSINWIASLLSFIARRLGDEAVEEALRDFGERYVRARRGADPGARKRMEAVVRAMKANGGTVEMSEDDEKYELRFRCGSGGMLIDTGAYEAPRAFHTVRATGPLTYGAESIGVYCAHCPVNNEIQPIEWDGAPATVVYPQTEPGGICTHHVYKDPSAVPPGVYARVGKTKP